MTTDQRYHLRTGCFKEWDPVFLTRRVLDSRDIGHSLCNDEVDLAFPLQEAESDVPSYMIEDIKEFCAGSNSVSPDADFRAQRRAAWIDDRSFHQPSSQYRNYPCCLSDAELYQLLSARVCNCTRTSLNLLRLKCSL
jgi:hypothetical protein